MKNKYQALHLYWLKADLARIHFYKDCIAKADQIDLKQGMYIWYSLLYVVIEGYQNLPLSQKITELEDLLKSKKDLLYKLKRLRNLVFHVPCNYNYSDKREKEFFETELIRAQDLLIIHNLLGEKIFERIR